MKIKLIVSSLLFITFSFGFSQQQGSLNISIEKSENNSQPQFLNVNFIIGQSLSQGAFIDLPHQIKPVINSIKLNGNDMWLINSPDPVEKDNVVGWFVQNDGIIIHYTQNLEGNLEIQIGYDTAQFNKIEQVLVALSGVIRTDQKFDIESSIQAQTNIPNIPNIQLEEN